MKTKKIIDIDNMTIIGFFDEKDAEKTKKKYLESYNWVGFDIDGDLTVSMDDDE